MFRICNLIFLFIISLSVYSQNTDREYWIGRFLSVSYPLKAVKINSSFGVRKDPFSGVRTPHSGLDLKAKFEEVYSMFDGTVKSVGYDSRSGNYVILTHGIYDVSYCHLSRVSVAVDMKVLAGDIVGVSGSTGRSTGPHLHITCRCRGELVDPYNLLVYICGVRREAIEALGGNYRVEDEIDRASFFDRYASLAMSHQRKYGIPASVTLAQMAYESFYGCSPLAINGNNFFGIKCSREWLASGKPYSLHDDDRPNEKFCNYSSVEESVDHHSRVLMGDRYKRCHRYKPTDYHNWLVGIKAAGYATAPDYVKKLESLIKRYKLYLFDLLAQKA